jgi:hypothetical protein
MKPATVPVEPVPMPDNVEKVALFVPTVVMVLLGVYPQPLLELLGKILI